MNQAKTFLAGVPGNPIANLQRADGLWKALREGTLPTPEVCSNNNEALPAIDWDVAICGGTLGILLGAALARQSRWRVVLLEKGTLRGREQEWNISREELETFVALELLSEAELEAAIATEYDRGRVQFSGGKAFWARGVLNVGVCPATLLETLKQRFLRSGGTLLENTPCDRVEVRPNGVAIRTGNGTEVTARLLVDAMGHFSPIARQAREGRKPDGVCLVVGSCARGYDRNETGDIMVSLGPIENQCQYFWEAFPARDGRTTYLFSYLDADPRRFDLSFFFEEYLRLLPGYQNVELDRLQVVRSLFGFFPSYRESPLRSPWDRVLFAGDSSGSQSPLSFGGFGAMVRHLKRLRNGIGDALQCDALDRGSLAWLHPYQPNLSVTWLFQKAMTVDCDRRLLQPQVPPNAINDLLSAVFEAMEAAGDAVLQPFLRDVVRFDALSQTLFRVSLARPDLVISLIPRLGLPSLLDWMRHYLSLGAYGAVAGLGDRENVAAIAKKVRQQLQRSRPSLSAKVGFYGDRWLDACRYGSGADWQERSGDRI